MIEILLNQLAIDLPNHFVAYAPVLCHLCYSKKRTFSLLAAAQIFWLALVCILRQKGIPLGILQLACIPLFGILYFHAVNMHWGKTLFLYIFASAYGMTLRGCASYLYLVLFGSSVRTPYAWQSSVLLLLLFLLTIPFILRFFRSVSRVIIEIDAPQIWRQVWILPLLTELLVLLFTYSSQQTSKINGLFLLARLLMMAYMFIACYFILHSIELFRQQAEAQEHVHYLQRLTALQSAQYTLLQTRIEETRRSRHDQRQHLNVIRSYLSSGNTAALSSYLDQFSETIPDVVLRDYCQNYTINSVLSFYAEKAARSDIEMEVAVCPMLDTIIPEPELCVLLGNLLENAVNACAKLGPSAAISVRAQRTGSHMLFLTVDNTCPVPPAMEEERFLSETHEGFGIGTESVRSIAKKYHGDARFEWKNGIFYASVMLNAK